MQHYSTQEGVWYSQTSSWLHMHGSAVLHNALISRGLVASPGRLRCMSCAKPGPLNRALKNVHSSWGICSRTHAHRRPRRRYELARRGPNDNRQRSAAHMAVQHYTDHRWVSANRP